MASVFVAEDEPLIGALLTEWLADMGHAVACVAATVEEAVKAADGASFDLALLDINLGRQRVDAVADILARRGIPFAFTTGGGADMVDPRFSTRPTLQKPFQFADLQRMIERLAETASRGNRDGTHAA